MNPQVLGLTQSATLKITALAKQIKAQGKDVVNFAAGEPDFDTPDFIKQAAKQAIDRGFTKYTPSSGDIRLKEAVCQRLISQGLRVDKNNIVITSGAKFAVYLALLAIVDSGDEVLIPSPYWVSYPEMVKLTPAEAKYVELPRENGFKLTAAALAKAITPKTKAVVFNYPSNPTGATYTEAELKEISQVIAESGIYLVSDEIYEALDYQNQSHTSIASLETAENQIITVSGVSKSFSMTGWRIGYLAAKAEIAAEIAKVAAHTTSCPCSISQEASIAALKNSQWEKEIKLRFQERRDLLYRRLGQIDKIKPIKPQGTFYMFCDISETGISAFDFCSQLLQEKLVACVPSEPFGKQGFVRISFSTSIEEINKGADRIAEFIESKC